MASSIQMPESNGSGGTEEPPDNEYDGPAFAEMDATGRYGRFDEVLGRGAFKVVYKAFDTQEGTEVAWNQVRICDLIPCKDLEKEKDKDRDSLFAEIRVLKALKHKNIMSFYDSWYDSKGGNVNFITELFTSGTLRQYRKRHKHVDDEVLKRWAWQILCGLVYLHGHNPPIIHRDLKCDNIFINGSDGVVKIGDLGLATMLRGRTAPQSVLGTPEFMAPELYEEQYDDRVDVYSFGMCLLELATMQYPYAECKNAAQIYRKVSLGVRPAGLQNVPSRELADFINTCIASRESRPRARQLLKHPYFDSIRRVLAPSKSEASLVSVVAMVGAGSERGELSATENSYLSRATSIAEPLAAAMGGGAPGNRLPPAPLTSGPPSVSSSASAGALSRTTSVAEALAVEKSVSDAASIVSQRSSGSELAQALVPAEAAAIAEAAASAATPAPAAADSGSSGSTPMQEGPRPPSPPPSPAQLGPKPAGSPAGSDDDACRCDASDRRFTVVGKYREDNDKLNLRLRICEPDGASRTVQFEFDVAVDTATDVAGEMVSDLELSPEDAQVIAKSITEEVASLAERVLDSQASTALVETAVALQQGLKQGALAQANSLDQDNLAAALALAEEEDERQRVVRRGTEEPKAAAPVAAASLSTSAKEVGSPEGLGLEASAASAHSVQRTGPARSPPVQMRSGSEAGGPSETQPVGRAAPQPPQRLVRSNSTDVTALASPAGGGTSPQSRRSLVRRSSSFNSLDCLALSADAGVVQGNAAAPLAANGRLGSGGMSPSSQLLTQRPLLQDVLNSLSAVATEERAGTPPLRPSRSSPHPAALPPPPPHPPSPTSSPDSLCAADVSAAPHQQGQKQGALGRSRVEREQPSRSPWVDCGGALGPAQQRNMCANLSARLGGALSPSPFERGGFGGGGAARGEQDGSQRSSRDPSPDGDCSGGSGTLSTESSLLIGAKKPKPCLDKSALRKQATAAMEAVQLQSLTGLHTSVGGSKNGRGMPMGAAKSLSNLAAVANGNGAGANGIAAAPADGLVSAPSGLSGTSRSNSNEGLTAVAGTAAVQCAPGSGP